jgi:hypothetical protein
VGARDGEARLAAVPGGSSAGTKEWDHRVTGSAALECAYVAAGIFTSAPFWGLKIWDVAAGVALVRAAGLEAWTREGPWQLFAARALQARRAGPRSSPRDGARRRLGTPEATWLIRERLGRPAWRCGRRDGGASMSTGGGVVTRCARVARADAVAGRADCGRAATSMVAAIASSWDGVSRVGSISDMALTECEAVYEPVLTGDAARRGVSAKRSRRCRVVTPTTDSLNGCCWRRCRGVRDTVAVREVEPRVTERERHLALDVRLRPTRAAAGDAAALNLDARPTLCAVAMWPGTRCGGKNSSTWRRTSFRGWPRLYLCLPRFSRAAGGGPGGAARVAR